MFYAPNSNGSKGLKMNCAEILEDVVAFCKKQIEELQEKTNVDDPSGYNGLNTRRGASRRVRECNRAHSDKKSRGKMIDVDYV